MSGVSSYINMTELNEYLNDSTNSNDEVTDERVRNMLTTNVTGIEGIPYQFMESVDRRINGTTVGRKYAEKIFSRMPLLFLTPCEPIFMDDFNDKERSAMFNVLLGNLSVAEGLNMLTNNTDKQRRFYTSDFKYEEYCNNIQSMLTCVAVYLGIEDEKVTLNGHTSKIIDANWASELNDDFATFFSSAENAVFYLDGMTQISESASNSTTESSICGQLNGLSDQINELRFLFGSAIGGHLGDAVTGITDFVGESLSGLGTFIGGGIVGSVLENAESFVQGAKITFPKIWQDSSFERSYQLDFKFRSPDHDSLSIFLNVLKPYCKLLALTLPRAIEDNNDVNVYTSPFLVKASAKGLFNIDMGIISSLSVSKGAECMWNDDGLPTQIDASITIEDLYSNAIHMDRYDNNPISNFGSVATLVNNTAYQDFLANMAGLNIAQMEWGRKTVLYNSLMRNYAATELSRVGNILSNSVSRQIGRLWRSI